jgi:hypothetical protein
MFSFLVNRARIDCSAHLLVSIELVRFGIPYSHSQRFDKGV